MDLQLVRRILQAGGPFATVYLEGRSPGEDARQQVRLRWNDLRTRLGDAGAPKEMQDSLEEALNINNVTEIQTDGRVLVANADGLLLNASWDAAWGSGDGAYYSDQPELGAHLREKTRAVNLLVAVVNQEGAVVRRVVAAETNSASDDSEAVVEASTSASVQKLREGFMHHRQIQRRANEAVKQNVRGVVDYLAEAVNESRPDVLVLAGGVQGRTALREELPPVLLEIHQEVGRGGLDDEGAEQALDDELRRVAGEVSAQRLEAQTQRYEQAKGNNLVTEGGEQVAHAARTGAIDTLLLPYQTAAPEEASLIALSAQTGAEVGFIAAKVADSVAAILHFDPPAET